MPVPTLVVVSGPPSSGKTSLAHALAQAVPCPAICRDEIKGLEPLAELAQLRLVQCNVDAAVAHQRYVRRNARRAHAVIMGTELEDWQRAYSSFDRVSLPAPSIDVDTTDEYVPDVAEIVEFVNRS